MEAKTNYSIIIARNEDKERGYGIYLINLAIPLFFTTCFDFANELKEVCEETMPSIEDFSICKLKYIRQIALCRLTEKFEKYCIFSKTKTYPSIFLKQIDSIKKLIIEEHSLQYIKSDTLRRKLRVL